MRSDCSLEARPVVPSNLPEHECMRADEALEDGRGLSMSLASTLFRL